MRKGALRDDDFTGLELQLATAMRRLGWFWERDAPDAWRVTKPGGASYRTNTGALAEELLRIGVLGG
jgi:hypothetical protein